MSTIGRGMPRARSMDEYIEMLKDALYEIQEVKATAEFDDYMNDSVLIADAMKPELEQVLKMTEVGKTNLVASWFYAESEPDIDRDSSIQAPFNAY